MTDIKRAAKVGLKTCVDPACGCGRTAIVFIDSDGKAFADAVLLAGDCMDLAGGLVDCVKRQFADVVPVDFPSVARVN